MAGFMKRMFRGMETPAEEKKEATALKAGKITPKQYVAGEKSEGHGAGAAKKAVAIKSGKMTPAAYAKEHAEKKATGGKVKRMMFGGIANAPQTAAQQNVMAQKASALKAAVTPKPAAQVPGKVGAAAQQALTRANAVRSAVAGKPVPAAMVRKATGGGVEAKGKTAGKTVKMAGGGCAMKPKKMAKGGGVESKGKTKGRMV